MTFYEKLKEKYPKATKEQLDSDVALLCPYDMGFEKSIPESCPNFRGAAMAEEACFRCWDRQMEGGA